MDEMMGYAEMIESLLEDTDFLLVEENRTNVQSMMHLFEELNTAYPSIPLSRGTTAALASSMHMTTSWQTNHCAKRGLATQSERVERIPSSPANENGTDALDAVHVPQKTIRELHSGKETDKTTNPDEVVASGAAVQAATSRRIWQNIIVPNARRRWPGSRRRTPTTASTSATRVMASSPEELLPCRR